ncbi:MAG: aspartate kinase [Acidobacteriota bacterium]|jgi:aspartate kinase
MKFGGTSVGDADAIRRVAGIIDGARGQRCVVVVSAIAGATRELLAIGEAAVQGGAAAARGLLDGLDARHQRILERLDISSPLRADVDQWLARSMRALGSQIDRIERRGQCSAEMQDAMLVHGELLSSRLVFAATREIGLPSRWVDATKVMVTDDRFRAARPDRNALARAVESALRAPSSAGEIPITQGFIGATGDGRPTTLGFEASDYSASLFGEALSAHEVQIWTDVPGMLTTGHPGIEGVHRIRRLSFEEAAVMSSFGAKVLHPRTVEPLVTHGIPLRIRDSRNAAGEGTLITIDGDGTRGIVKCLAVQHDANVGALRSTMVRHADDRAGGSLVSLVGRDVGDCDDVRERAAAVVEASGFARIVPTRTPHAISLLVDPAAVAGLVQALHAAFFGARLDAEIFAPMEPVESAR